MDMAWTWLCDWDLLDNPNSKELPPGRALHSFWALSKCQFGDTTGEAMRCTFLYHLLLYEDKVAAVHINIRWVWDSKYHYHLDLTSTVFIWAKLPHLCPEEEAWLDIHLDKLVAKGVVGHILLGEQLRCIIPLLLVPGIQSRQPYWMCQNIVPVNK